MLSRLVPALPSSGLVWGGDWNHALAGPELVGSREGRECLLEALGQLNLKAPTSQQPSGLPGMNSIDHIGVPATAHVKNTTHVSATVDRRALSDHDAYVVELQNP